MRRFNSYNFVAGAVKFSESLLKWIGCISNALVCIPAGSRGDSTAPAEGEGGRSERVKWAAWAPLTMEFVSEHLEKHDMQTHKSFRIHLYLQNVFCVLRKCDRSLKIDAQMWRHTFVSDSEGDLKVFIFIFIVEVFIFFTSFTSNSSLNYCNTNAANGSIINAIDFFFSTPPCLVHSPRLIWKM